MLRRPTRSTRTYTLFPYTTLFRSYGGDSIIVTEIMKRISDVLALPFAPTVFFEARHLEELADILYRRYHRSIERHPPENRSAGTSTVAIAADASQDGHRVEASDAAAAIGGSEIAAEAKPWIDRVKEIAASASRRSEERRVGKGCVSKCRSWG